MSHHRLASLGGRVRAIKRTINGVGLWGWVKERGTKSEAQRRKTKINKKKGEKGFGLWVRLRIGLSVRHRP